MDDDKTEKIRERLLEDPRLTVVPDGAIADVAADNFDLPLRIGPVYDILRHPDTVTPLAVAIYGDWGAGKTSAMLWLDDRLKDWTAHEPKKGGAGKGTGQKKIRLHTVWFYPWKYQSRDDVWRGLVAEVIIACLSRDLDSAQQFWEEAKDLARFLGKSAWTLVSSLKLSAGAGAGAKATFDFKALDKLAEHANDYVHPEAAYLNQFEEALESWVKKSLGGDERLVVFIDDLDRCMPEVALQVLEALKLYLNIGNLIFVVGVDDSVIGDLVVKRYRELGLDERKARQYLAKMFQVEVPLTPSDVQIKDFLGSILAANPTWQEIEEQAQSVFRDVIGELAERSPREVKRLVNSALMRGAGASMSALAHETGKTPKSEQGMQVFLVRWVLDRRHRRGGLVARDVGTRFFRAWSQIVRDHPKADPWLALSKEAIAAIGEERFLDWAPRDEGLPPPPGKRLTPLPGLPLPPPPGKPLPGMRQDPGRGGETADWERIRRDIPERFLPILQEKRFHPFLELLADHELGELMRIEYPEEAVSISVTAESTSAQAIVDEAIARVLEKPASELTPEDRRAVKKLELSQEDLDDLVPLKALTGLESLSIQGTQVSDLEPLKGLAGLKLLNLQGTQVRDLEPLKGLTGIESLDLRGTQVRDLEPLKGLAGLKLLNLQGMQVSDLEPLKGLTGLEWLDLQGTQVSDLEPLKGLTGLEVLDLQGTQVSDLEPLKGLAGLEWLSLQGTQVSDLELLKGLTGLESLSLQRTQVSDLEPLKGLTGLESLYLQGTQVSDLEPLKGLTGLEWLHLQDTQVRDLEPLKGLTGLDSLSLQGTQVSDLGPLKGLAGLKLLNLQGTQVSDLELLKGLTGLESLDLQGTQVSDLEPLKGLTGLEVLDLQGTQVSGLEPLKGLAGLEWLNLHGTQVSDLEPLKGLTELRRLYLSATKFDAETVEELRNALPEVQIITD